jgi:hypothetical protein
VSCRAIAAALLALGLGACDRAVSPPTADGTAAVQAPQEGKPPAEDLGDPPEDILEVGGDDDEGDDQGTPPEYDAAPWSAAPLAAADVPAEYLAQWRKAGNRDTCAPLAPADLGEHAAATPRAADFSGGWAVAYDEPGLRSAFGVAGAGIEPDPGGESPFPYEIAWADGSVAHYGLEGGTGPGHLAYLTVEGQGCLYNVWSRHGEAHLLSLLESLRYVAKSAGAP